MEKQHLPQRQREVFDFITDYHRAHGFAPAYKEIAAALGLGSSTVITYIGILKQKGFVNSLPGIPRSLTVIDPAPPEAGGEETARNDIPDTAPLVLT
jgi:repressor LexA